MSELEGEGIKAQPIDIEVDELVRWCREQHRPIDQAARAACASFKLRSTMNVSAKRTPSNCPK